MTLDMNRRAADRHETVNKRTSVQLSDWTGLRVKQATLVNFSSSGALILTDQAPALHQPLRMRLENAKEIGWFSAIPVRTGQPNEVGIKFARPFPFEFLPDFKSERDSPLDLDNHDETR